MVRLSRVQGQGVPGGATTSPKLSVTARLGTVEVSQLGHEDGVDLTPVDLEGVEASLDFSHHGGHQVGLLTSRYRRHHRPDVHIFGTNLLDRFSQRRLNRCLALVASPARKTHLAGMRPCTRKLSELPQSLFCIYVILESRSTCTKIVTHLRAPDLLVNNIPTSSSIRHSGTRTAESFS